MATPPPGPGESPRGVPGHAGGVVDPRPMAVHGTEGLFVADASAFPTLTNANIYAPTMMLAEMAADLLQGNTPLPPERRPFYQATPGT